MEFGKRDLYPLGADPGGYGIFLLNKKPKDLYKNRFIWPELSHPKQAETNVNSLLN
tara:strand:- start:466 stop:633 length:168 start_codon:yes stop_codon:yes gene_type:complete